MIVLIIASVAMMSVDHRSQNLQFLRAAISIFVLPAQYLVNIPVEAGYWAGESLQSRGQLEDDNAQLKMQNTLLKTQLQKLNAIEAENQRLRQLLRSSKRVGEKILIGEVIAVDLDPFSRQLVLNKGIDADVFEGQPILDADGVMGQVVHVAAFNSIAMLITDPNHAIPIQVNRNGLRAIAVGTGNQQQLDIPNLPNNTDIKEGDLLITSGLGGRFPPGYPVARVTKVETNPAEAYARITAEPTAKLDRNREVLMVWPESRLNKPDLTQVPAEDSADGSPQKTPAQATTP